MTRLLVIAPHADDAELGCGGYIDRVVSEGGKAHMAVVAVGDVFFQHLNRTVTAEERIAELSASAFALGSGSSVLFKQHDGLLDTMPLKDIVSGIEHELDVFEPTEVLIPLPSSHQDHEVVYRACLAAMRPSALIQGVSLIAAYEYPATSWGAGSSADAGKGGLYVELSGQNLHMKNYALRKYKTQIRDEKHPWSVEASNTMAKMRGLEAGVEYAELFHVLRMMKRAT